MPRIGCILLETPDGWLLRAAGRTESMLMVEECADVDAIAAAVEAFADEHQLQRDRLLIAPCADSVIFATFPVSDLPKSRDRQTLTFQLERSLPFDAEEVVADFHIGKDLVSSVAVIAERLLPLVTALEERGLLVQSIVPAAALACQALIADRAKTQTDRIVWESADAYDVLSIKNSQIVEWRHLPGDPRSLMRTLQVECAGQEQITLIDASPALLGVIEESDWAVQEVRTSGFSESAADAAHAVLSGRREPWFDLRRGPLANGDPHRPYRAAAAWAVVAAALLLIGLSGALWWRTAQLHQRFDDLKQAQRDLFDETFAGSPVPRAVVSRMESEHARMLGSRRMTADVPRSRSALEVLHGMLTGLPTNVRTRVTEVRIDNGDLMADVELRSHDDAGLVATALEETGFDVEPPTTTQRDAKTITSQLQAEWAPSGKEPTSATRAAVERAAVPEGI